VRDQATTIVERLRRSRVATFRSLSSDSCEPLTTVARFLALLELFREGVVAFDQLTPMGELSVRWTGTDHGEIEVVDEYDEAPSAEPEPAASVTEDDLLQLTGERR
jgi:segregation and condensation protein A